MPATSWASGWPAPGKRYLPNYLHFAGMSPHASLTVDRQRSGNRFQEIIRDCLTWRQIGWDLLPPRAAA
ncbi:MAG: hypothetical protein U1E33_04410 [Rhodospirillales bacterium]